MNRTFRYPLRILLTISVLSFALALPISVMASDAGSAITSLHEDIESVPQATIGDSATLQTADPEILGAIVATVVTVIVVALVDNPDGPISSAVKDVVGFVADAYESTGSRCDGASTPHPC